MEKQRDKAARRLQRKLEKRTLGPDDPAADAGDPLPQPDQPNQ